MPGELGNEDEQQGVGYYEHRYDSGGEPMCDPRDKKLPMEMEERPKSQMVMNVIQKSRNKE